MGKALLHPIGIEPGFMQDGGCGAAEVMQHEIPRVDLQGADGVVQGVLGNGLIKCSPAGEYP
jgi:hypothetical protein